MCEGYYSRDETDNAYKMKRYDYTKNNGKEFALFLALIGFKERFMD